MVALNSHENGHVKIGLDNATEFGNRTSSLSMSVFKKTQAEALAFGMMIIKEELDIMADDAKVKTQNENTAYDDSTHHGANQDASLDVSKEGSCP
ncbi:MAG: DUF922 domain-containing protein [Fibrobacteria bacterium]